MYVFLGVGSLTTYKLKAFIYCFHVGIGREQEVAPAK